VLPETFASQQIYQSGGLPRGTITVCTYGCVVGGKDLGFIQFFHMSPTSRFAGL